MDRLGLPSGLAFAALLLFGLLPVRAIAATTVPLERFFGEYVGEAITQSGEDIDKRLINAKIRPYAKGFEMTWTMVIEKQGGKLSRDESTFRFLPSKREGVFTSAMRTDMFGNAVPLDPIKGDPYLWARLEGETLTIFALLITEEGGYEIQVYERTLQPGGLGLKFSRFRDGKLKRAVTGSLKKIK